MSHNSKCSKEICYSTKISYLVMSEFHYTNTDFLLESLDVENIIPEVPKELFRECNYRLHYYKTEKYIICTK